MKRVPQRRTNRSMSGLQLLHKATGSRDWRMQVDNRMNNTFGETDPATRTIKINKKLHAQKSGGHLMKNPDGSEKLIGTIVHELTHAGHPQMHERTVRKVAKKRVGTLSTQTKQKLYSRLRG